MLYYEWSENSLSSINPILTSLVIFTEMSKGSQGTFQLSSASAFKGLLYCQALSISQSLNLSLSMRDRDRADTIITFHHHHPPTENFLSAF